MSTHTTATLTLLPSQTVADVPDRLFGSFVEHLGRCVHGGTSPDALTAPFVGGYDPAFGYRAVGGFLKAMATPNQNQH
jgi:hypothetical protein